MKTMDKEQLFQIITSGLPFDEEIEGYLITEKGAERLAQEIAKLLTAQEGERVNFTDAELAEHQEAWDAYGKLTAQEEEWAKASAYDFFEFERNSLGEKEGNPALTAQEGEADRETQEVTRQLVERYVSYEEIAERVYLEYLDWIAEWDGDYPNEREYTTFLEYLEEMR
jgi:hypothetical protein